MDIRIDGIYDGRTIDFLRKNEVSHLGFNFSPKNLNFLQQKDFLQLMGQETSLKETYYLNFSYDSSHVMRHLLERIKTQFYERGLDFQQYHLYLEFENDQVLNDNDLPSELVNGVFWHYRPDTHVLKDILKVKNLKGIFLHYRDLYEMHDRGTLFSFVQNFMASFYAGFSDTDRQHEEEALKLGLICDWDSDFFPSLFELFDFDILSYSVTSEVEVCFRNVDLDRVGRSLGHIRQVSLS